MSQPGLRIYIATAYRNARMVRALHTALVALGHTPTSRWAEAAGGSEYLSDDIAAQAIRMNDHDVMTSDLVIALGLGGAGRAMYGEVRVACAMGIPVAYLGPDYLDAHRKEVIVRGELTEASFSYLFRHSLRCPHFLGTVRAMNQVQRIQEVMSAA